jgi:hypothetical protein
MWNTIGNVWEHHYVGLNHPKNSSIKFRNTKQLLKVCWKPKTPLEINKNPFKM